MVSQERCLATCAMQIQAKGCTGYGFHKRGWFAPSSSTISFSCIIHMIKIEHLMDVMTPAAANTAAHLIAARRSSGDSPVRVKDAIGLMLYL